MTGRLDPLLLSRIEDAGLNASAPPQQRWLDGWLLRFSPGKAKRARCINAVALGRLPLEQKLERAAEVYREAQLPMVLRITPFTQPAALDARLQALGMASIDDTRVMVSPQLPPGAASPSPVPDHLMLQPVGHAVLAQTVGLLRGSPLSQRQAHAQRLEMAPVPFHGFVLRRRDDGVPLACAQVALEAELVGLYDVYTAEASRGKGYATLICEHTLSFAATRGAKAAYLQVDADNVPARSLYGRMGFSDGYAYHYRVNAAS